MALHLKLSVALTVAILGSTLYAHTTNRGVLTPSHQSLQRQNICVDQMGLQRFQNEDEVQDAVRRGVLIALPITLGLHVAPNLPLSRRYALPTTVQFLLTLS